MNILKTIMYIRSESQNLRLCYTACWGRIWIKSQKWEKLHFWKFKKYHCLDFLKRGFSDSLLDFLHRTLKCLDLWKFQMMIISLPVQYHSYPWPSAPYYGLVVHTIPHLNLISCWMCAKSEFHDCSLSFLPSSQHLNLTKMNMRKSF